MDRKREKLCAFTPGKLTVDAYSREFRNLARYATKDGSTHAKKRARFRKGLSPELRRDLRLHECTSFQALVNKAISAETGHTDYEATKKHSRDSGSSSGSVFPKRRLWVPNSSMPPRYTPRPSYVVPQANQTNPTAKISGGPASNAAPRANHVICYKCREPGHYSRECPQNIASKQPGKSVGQGKPAKHIT